MGQTYIYRTLNGKTRDDVINQLLACARDSFILCPNGIMKAENPASEVQYSTTIKIADPIENS